MKFPNQCLLYGVLAESGKGMRSGKPAILVARVLGARCSGARVLGCWLRSGMPVILVAQVLGAGCWLNL